MRKNDMPCEVILDLLPLFEDGCCSEQSETIVREHLETCDSCRRMSSLYQEELPQEEAMTVDETEAMELKAIKKKMNRIKLWKVLGITLLCMIPITIFGIIPWKNYKEGRGITYTNIKETHMAHAFVEAIITGDYEEAYSYLNVRKKYDDLLATNVTGRENGEVIAKGIEEIESNGFEWYDEVCKEAFITNMELLKTNMEIITVCSNFEIREAYEGFTVYFDVETQAKTSTAFVINVTEDGIKNFYTSTIEAVDSVTGKKLKGEALEKKNKMMDRLYRFPSLNETIMEMLYEEIDFDWRGLFEY